MHDAPGTLLEEPVSVNVPSDDPGPRLLVELEPRRGAFFENLRDTVRPRKLPHLRLDSAPAAFWPDVFVERKLPWWRFVESGGCHVVALIFFFVFSRFLAMQPKPVVQKAFDHSQVIYYSPSEYLPPIDTRRVDAAPTRKADPEIARQPVISVPPQADNRSQTVVAPPNVKLQRDVPMPNIVSWGEKPRMPIAPAPLVPASSITRLKPLVDSVVAPPPDPTRTTRRDLPNVQTTVVAPPPDLHTDSRTLHAADAAVIAPPVETNSSRHLGDINIGRTDVIAPAPQLPVNEKRARSASTLSGTSAQVVPPPPSVATSAPAGSAGRVVALNLHPTVGAAPDSATGNRRGAFAATPEGHAGASGALGSASGTNSAAVNSTGGHGNENGSSGGTRKANSELPSGLYVGNASPKTSPVAGNPATSPANNSVNPNLIASVPPPRISSKPAHPLEEGNASKLTEAERQVFADRKFYALTLNMPNLNSAGGSWVIRFAELKPDANEKTPPNLSAPEATHKVDPAYPLQLMRENVSGTVILYAVIHADGTVGNVRVIRSVDDRIDQFASQAIARWQFAPATKNGAPIDVEATFQIPFRPVRQRSNF